MMENGKYGQELYDGSSMEFLVENHVGLRIHPPLNNPTIGIRVGSFRNQFNH
jgi:hypothetical protein